MAWLLVAIPLCLSGLGLFARRWLGSVRTELLPIAGLGLFVFAGGVLNLLHIALACSIGIILMVGFLNWTARAYRLYCDWSLAKHKAVRLVDPQVLLLGLLAIGIVALTASSQISPSVFNWRDDLQKYFAYPVRMLETGTVFGSPLSAIGLESLGGMSFVHAAALICLPLQGLNGVDAVLGLLLCLIPLLGFGARNAGLRAVAAVAMASVVIIDPYYVNTSALFLAAALIMGSVFLSEDGPVAATSPALLGLSYAALLSLKPVFVLFALPHLVLLAAAAGLSAGPRIAARWALRAALWTGLFISPWIALHLPHYLAPTAPHSPATKAMLRHSVDLMGLGPTLMGLTGLRAYTILAAVLVVLVVVCLGLPQGRRIGTTRRVGPAMAGLVSVAAYPFMIYALPRLLGYADADTVPVRYCVPIFIGVFPAVLCAAAACLEEGYPGLTPTARTGVGFAVGVSALVTFSGTAAQRFRDAGLFGTFMPFPVAHQDGLAEEMKYALGPLKQRDVLAQQAMIPAGASVIAWINTPYFLDYSRNTIFDAEAAGIAAPWATPPESDYILWEYRGSVSPQERTRRLIASLPEMDARLVAPLVDFDRTLWARVQSGKVIFKNEEFLLVRTAAR